MKTLESILLGLIGITILALAPPAAEGASKPHGTNTYSFRETVVFEELDSDGRVKSTSTEVKEVFPVEGHLFGRVISRNGKPLPTPEELEETQRLEKFRTAIREGKMPKESGESFESVSAEFADVKDGAIQEGVQVQKMGIEQLGSRRCMVYGFSSAKKAETNSPSPQVETKPQVHDPDAKDRRKFGQELMKSARGKVWIDEEDQATARLDLGLFRPMHVSWCMVTIKRLDFHVDFRRLEPKLWTPESATALVNVRAFLVVNYNFRVKMTRDNFKKTAN